METLNQMQKRIQAFSIHSLYCREDVSFEPNPNLIYKVDETGALQPYYGNSMIFELKDDKLLSLCQTLCHQVNQSEMMAEPLLHHTMHMTLHDLVNGANLVDIAQIKAEIGIQALEVLNNLPKFELKMKPVRVYSMNQTSIVLGMEAVNEEHHQTLMRLYEAFQSIYPLSYPLTPHITLSYYRPNIYSKEAVLNLQEYMRRANDQLKRVEITLKIDDLKLMEFISMNQYIVKEAKKV